MKFKYKFKKFLLFFFVLYLPVFFYVNKEKEVKGEVVVGTAALLVMLAAAAYGVTLYSTSPEKLEELATDLMDEYELARSKFQVINGGGGGDDDKPPSWRELLEKVRTSGGKFAFSTGAMACMSGWANKLYNKMGINKKISFANEKINGFVNSLFGTEVKDVPVTSFKRLVNSNGQGFFPNFSIDFYVGLYGGCDARIRDCLADFRNDVLYRDYVLVYTALEYIPNSYDYRIAKYYFIHKNDLSNVDTIDIYEGFDRWGYIRIFSCPNTSFTSIRQIYSDTGNFKNGMYAGVHYTDASKEQSFGYRTTDNISVYLNPALISKIRFLPSTPSPTSSPIQYNVKSDFDIYAVNDLLDKFLDTYKVPDIQQPLNVPSQKIINNINNNYYNPDGSIKAELQDIKNVLQDLTHNINPNINNHYEYVTNVFNEPSPSPNPSPEPSPSPSPNPSPEPSPSPVPDVEPVPDDFKFSNLKEPSKFLLPAWIIDRFPFCLPFDLFKILKKLNTEPKAPKFSFYLFNNEILIDLSRFDFVMLVFRRLMTILFVISLIYTSKVMIKN